MLPKVLVSSCCVVADMSGNIQQQRQAVEQLRREANIKRISVSQAVEDIKVSYHQADQTLMAWLVVGIFNLNNNFFCRWNLTDKKTLLGTFLPKWKFGYGLYK